MRYRGEVKSMLENEKYDCRLALLLPAYDPYKDAFDIYMDLFMKNWPDCPYPFIVTNMNFQCDYPLKGFRLINCGDEKRYKVRLRKGLDAINAKYYLILEEDRMFTQKIDTCDIEEILNFMDEYDVKYYRMNPSFFKKKKRDRYGEKAHHYHVLAKEPYGRSGATSIWRADYIREFQEIYEDEYAAENTYLKESLCMSERYVKDCATDDRNVLHVLHCIEKSKWVKSSQKRLEKMGYDFSSTILATQSLKQYYIYEMKSFIGKCIPMRLRYRVKKILRKFGMKFSTDY